jgi:hypothetical protein
VLKKPCLLVCAMLLAVMACAACAQEGADEPGLEDGQPAPAFELKVLTGPEDFVGKDVDFVQAEGWDPLLLVIITKITDESKDVIAKVGEWAKPKDGEDPETKRHAIVVFVVEPSDENTEAIKALAAEKEIAVPMGYPVDAAKLIADYDLSEDTGVLLQVLASDNTIANGTTDLAAIGEFLNAIEGDG